MNIPADGELTATEQRAYDLLAFSDGDVVPVVGSLARALSLEEPVMALVLDGLEAMGFVERRGGFWFPNYREA